MREVVVTNTYKVYNFEELNDTAKEKVRQWYLDGQESDIFTEILLDDLHYNLGFKDSELEVEYSLASCQGDGVNIYGKLKLAEVLEQIKDKFTDNEYEYLKMRFESFDDTFEMPSNGRYTYCICDRHNYTEKFIERLEEDGMNIGDVVNNAYHTYREFDKECRKFFCELCRKYELMGYEYFYEIEDEDLAEICAMNEYEFLEDGTLFLN